MKRALQACSRTSPYYLRIRLVVINAWVAAGLLLYSPRRGYFSTTDTSANNFNRTCRGCQYSFGIQINKNIRSTCAGFDIFNFTLFLPLLGVGAWFLLLAVHHSQTLLTSHCIRAWLYGINKAWLCGINKAWLTGRWRRADAPPHVPGTQCALCSLFPRVTGLSWEGWKRSRVDMAEVQIDLSKVDEEEFELASSVLENGKPWISSHLIRF